MVAYLAANPASCMLAIAIWIHSSVLQLLPILPIFSFISLSFSFTALDHTNLVATILARSHIEDGVLESAGEGSRVVH